MPDPNQIPTPPATPPAEPGAAPAVPNPPTQTPPAAPPAQPPAPPAEPPKGAPPASPSDPTETPADIKLTAPEGISFADGALEKFASTAKDLKLSPDQAQKLVDWQATINKEAQAQEETMRAQIIEDLKKETIEHLSAGGKNPDQELSKAAKAMLVFGGQKVVDVLKRAGLDSQVDIVSHFIKLGEKVSEDSFAEGQSRSNTQKSASDVIHDHPTSKAV